MRFFVPGRDFLSILTPESWKSFLFQKVVAQAASFLLLSFLLLPFVKFFFCQLVRGKTHRHKTVCHHHLRAARSKRRRRRLSGLSSSSVVLLSVLSLFLLLRSDTKIIRRRRTIIRELRYFYPQLIFVCWFVCGYTFFTGRRRKARKRVNERFDLNHWFRRNLLVYFIV